MASKKKTGEEVSEAVEKLEAPIEAKKAPKKAKEAPKEGKIKMAEVYTAGPKEEEILEEVDKAKGDEELEEYEGDIKDFEGEDEEGKVEAEIEKVVVKEEEGEEGGKEWAPKTKLGELVKFGKVTPDDIFETGQVIREPEIIDILFPNLQEITMLIGGSPGKGGGIQRRPSRRTVRVHKSGRRTSVSMMTIVGDTRGYLGVGIGKANSNKAAREKSLKTAKLNLFPVKKGCGSWECSCGEGHSIPFTTHGKAGSVEVKLMPAPKGLGLCATDEMKKLFQAAGVRDIRMKTRGKTHSRMNFIYAIEDAFKNANRMR